MAEERVKGSRKMEEGEEERATIVPNREGKAKSRWMVAMVHEEAPRPT